MSKWDMVRLGELCDLDNGFAFKSSDYIRSSNTIICRMSNIRPNATFDTMYNVKYLPDEYGIKYSNYLLNDGDLIIAMTDMANDPKILGVPTVVNTQGYNMLLNQRVGRLCFFKDDIDKVFLKYALCQSKARNHFKKFAGGGLQINLGKKEILSVEVPLPPIETQKKIAKTLDTAAELLALRKQQLAELDNLIKSTFYDMFGDPVANEKGWEIKELGNISDIQGGLQVTSKRVNNPIELPYLRVANVYRDLLDLREIKTIKVTEAEAERICLKRGDILIVEGHGNPTEIGRCAVWDGSIHVCLHQNHLIRVRVHINYALPAFISYYINSESGRQQMFKAGKTTSGLNTISTKNVKETLVLLPALSLQTQFAEVVTKIEEQKSIIKKAIDETQYLFDSLMSQYFD